MKNTKEKPSEIIFSNFARQDSLSTEQVEQFQEYEKLLKEWNEKFNLTAITDTAGIVNQHFRDSLILKNFMDLNKVNSIADIGPGAGFPSIPLKIAYPNLKVYLIEVNQKKQKFLDFIVKKLNLSDVEIIDLDWRTFLRKTEHDIDYFVTKAALHEVELIRMFKASCYYKNSKLIYWASFDWIAYPKAVEYILHENSYKLNKKDRKLVFMGVKK